MFGEAGTFGSASPDMADNIRECLEEVLTLEGALGAALVEWTTGTLVDVISRAGFDLTERAAVGNAEVVLAKIAVMGAVERIEPIEDIIITLETQYHAIRLLKVCPTRFLYAIFDRSRANLAQSRLKLADLEDLLVIDDLG